MKTPLSRFLLTSAISALAAALILLTSAQAQVTGINSVAGSFAAIQFDDTTSTAPPPGVTNVNPTVTPWNGATWSLPFTTDPNTFDTAQGDITGAVILGNYDIAFNNVLLSQAIGNTGFAHLIFNFSVEFQLGALGLPSQATLYPNFVVNGTVQPAGFAKLNGFINYSGVNTAGTISVVETVNYNSAYLTPGPFTNTAAGIPVNGTTPALVANTTLTLSGMIDFMVDPATINAHSVTVPEPSSALLALLAAPLLLRRRKGPIASSLNTRKNAQ